MTPEPLSRSIRGLIEDTLPDEAATYDRPPEPRFFFVPSRHERALDLDKVLVAGIRGAGKSVWWGALQSQQHRALLASTLPKLQLSADSKVTAGFGAKPQTEEYPDQDILASLLGAHVDGRMIWRTVMVWQTWGRKHAEVSRLATWKARTKWVEDHPEEVASGFDQYESELGRARHLVLFDALDRTADDWDSRRILLRGLLRTLLDFRARSSIRAKAFVRPDMLDDNQVVNFPDASKVLNSRVDLLWDASDLYSLLWQYLGNSAGPTFREETATRWRVTWTKSEAIFGVPDKLRVTAYQREVFHAIAGPWMGTDPRRGFPFSWLQSHLGDSRRQVSPRSFLSALRTAANDTKVNRTGHVYPLHYESIKVGVQSASKIRVEEVREDSPWIVTAMTPLTDKKISIPCDFADIEGLWMKSDVLKEIRREKIRPKHSDLKTLLAELETLGLVFVMDDGRINMPDVYRVGFGLGRRGGIKPIR